MMMLLKMIGVLVGLISSLLVFAVVCLVAINASDRTKSPNTLLVESWLKQQPVASSENGVEYAMKMLSTIEGAKSNPQETSLSFSTQQTKLIRDFKEACHLADWETCNEFFNRNSVTINRAINAHQANIDKYNILVAMPDWQENDQSLIPQDQILWSQLFQLRELSLLETMNRSGSIASKIGVDAAIAFLNKETHFWNNVYHSSGSLLVHMIVSGVLKEQLRFAGTLAQSNKEVVKNISAWQSPFSLNQNDYERIFSGEWLFGHNAMQQMVMEAQQDTAPFYEQWLAKMFIKPIDDDNLRAEYFVNMVKEPVSTDASLMLKKPEYCNNDNSLLQLWQLRYNPVGKILSCSYYETDLKLRIVNMNNEIEQLRSNLMMTQ
ncbi:hypothetical protein [Shewanella sp. MEBiC00475]|uniref:hypothetical protein n=1 Tax=Shewanella sp. MEBiC00475 TaxID=2575361 RepID=UPI0010C02121|nr:hypothetical protein [Shewanella sp. MEBiC00475]